MRSIIGLLAFGWFLAVVHDLWVYGSGGALTLLVNFLR